MPLPHPDSPAGRFIHWQTEIWALEQRERDEIARHVEELETSLARHSDKLRESIPDGYLRTLYDRQVGRTKGTYDFAKSLVATGVDATLLLQKLTSPVGWLDPDLQRKLRQSYSFGVAVSKVYGKWEFGTLQEKKQVLQQVGALAERVYDEAKNSIQRQWTEAKRAGKQEELSERWKTRLLLELGALAVGAGELKAASSTASELKTAQITEANRLLRADEAAAAANRADAAAQKVAQNSVSNLATKLTKVSPETAEKILRGAQNNKGDLIGVHSAEVLDHPDFATNVLKTNPDGTVEAEVVKRYPDGTLSGVKKSTLAPKSWSNAKIISATEQVGDTPPVGTRSHDGATCHMGEVDGVKWVTIKDRSGNVTAGYPNPSGAKPGGFK